MNNRMLEKTVRGLVTAWVLVMATGCQMFQSVMPFSGEDESQGREGTLAALPASKNRQASESAEVSSGPGGKVSIEMVMDSYRALLPLVEDPRKQVLIRHRLADLEFQRAERKMADMAVDELSGVIDAYQRLLSEYPEREGNDQIYYQLARAWELRGATSQQLEALDTLVQRYPNSEYWIEAQFRRGDLLFIDGRYREAEQAFEQVTLNTREQTADASFLVNAHYMKGWSLFKQAKYQEALLSYVDVLDLVMPEGQPAANGRSA